MQDFGNILNNHVLMVALFSCGLAQVLKVFVELAKHGKVNLRFGLSKIFTSRRTLRGSIKRTHQTLSRTRKTNRRDGVFLLLPQKSIKNQSRKALRKEADFRFFCKVLTTTNYRGVRETNFSKSAWVCCKSFSRLSVAWVSAGSRFRACNVMCS